MHATASRDKLTVPLLIKSLHTDARKLKMVSQCPSQRRRQVWSRREPAREQPNPSCNVTPTNNPTNDWTGNWRQKNQTERTTAAELRQMTKEKKVTLIGSKNLTVSLPTSTLTLTRFLSISISTLLCLFNFVIIPYPETQK